MPEKNIIIFIARPGKFQEGCAALLKEITETQSFQFENWSPAAAFMNNSLPTLLLIEAALINENDRIDFRLLHSQGIKILIFEDNPLMVEKWYDLGVDMVMLVGELASVLYTNINRLLERRGKTNSMFI